MAAIFMHCLRRNDVSHVCCFVLVRPLTMGCASPARGGEGGAWSSFFRHGPYHGGTVIVFAPDRVRVRAWICVCFVGNCCVALSVVHCV